MVHTIYVPVGPAGCGKSTYLENLKRLYPELRIYRLSPDEIRFKRLNSAVTGVYFDANDEPNVWDLVWKEFVNISQNPNIDAIYFDATNLTLDRRYQIHARSPGMFLRFIWFNIPLNIILARNNKRDRKVPEGVIAKQYLALQPPEEWEYDEILVMGEK